VIEPDREGDCTHRPAQPLAPERRQQHERHQQQETDVHRAHHRARQRAVGGGDDLERGEDDRDRVRLLGKRDGAGLEFGVGALDREVLHLSDNQKNDGTGDLCHRCPAFGEPYFRTPASRK
jgi:hypothetical protein